MTCGYCGSEVVELVDQDGGTVSGRFHEHYHCQACDRHGRIIGRAEESPEEWKRLGICNHD